MNPLIQSCPADVTQAVAYEKGARATWAQADFRSPVNARYIGRLVEELTRHVLKMMAASHGGEGIDVQQ